MVALESVQDFLIKLDMKTRMHLVEISIFAKSCHGQTYQNYEQSRQKLDSILGNKVLWKSKFSETFLNTSWSPSQIFFNENFFWKDLTQKNGFESTNFEMFKEVVHNFGKSDDDMI